MNDTKYSYWRDALAAFARMSGWVAGPVLLALVFGKALDKKFGTAPLLFVIMTGIAFMVSIAGLVHEGKKYMKRAEEDAQNSKTKNNE